MPQRGTLWTKGRQLSSRYPRTRNKKNPKPKIESDDRMDILDIIRKPILLKKMLLKRGLDYSSSSSGSSDFDLFDKQIPRPSNTKLIDGDDSNFDMLPPAWRNWSLDDSGDVDDYDYDNPQDPILTDDTIDFDNSFDFGPLDLDSPRSTVEKDNGRVDRECLQSTLNYDAARPRSIYSVYSDLPEFSPEQSMDDNNNGNKIDSFDIDSTGRPTLNKANVDNTPPQTQNSASFLNTSLQERLADFSSDSDEDDGYDMSEIGHALEDIPYEEFNTDTDTSESDSFDAPDPELCPQPRRMLSIPSSCSSSVYGFSTAYKVNIENLNVDKPQYWDLMIKLIPPAKPRKFTYDYYEDEDDDEGEGEDEDSFPEQEVDEPVVKIEASEEGYSLLKSFYKVVSETRASGEIEESDLDNTDTLKDLISRAAKMIIPDPEPEPINDLSDSEIQEEFEGLPILYPVLARQGNSILYEFVASAVTDRNEEQCRNAGTEEPTGTNTDDLPWVTWVKGRSLELTELMESCLSSPSLKLIRKGHGFMNPEASVQIPGRTAEFWPKFTFSHKMQDPIDKSRFGIKVRISYELVQLRPVIDLFYECYREDSDPDDVRKLSKELEGNHVFCKQIGEIYTIKKVREKHSLIYNDEPGGETSTDFSIFRATISTFADKFGIPLDDFDFQQPLLECQSFKRDSDEKPIYLLPQFCYLVGVRSEIGNGPDFYMDMFEVSTVQRHTACSRIKQFMATFSKMPEVENELRKWGLAFLGEYVYEKTGPKPDTLSEAQLPERSSRYINLNYGLLSTCSSDDDAWEELIDKCFSDLISFRHKW